MFNTKFKPFAGGSAENKIIRFVTHDMNPYYDPAWPASDAARDRVHLTTEQDGQAFAKDSARKQRKWISKQELLDQIEQAEYARWGPVDWTAGANAPHNPQFSQVDVLSPTLGAKERHNWILTVLDETRKKRAARMIRDPDTGKPRLAASKPEKIFSVLVRDKDGILRTPNFQEWKAVRFRERDRRLPFDFRPYMSITEQNGITAGAPVRRVTPPRAHTRVKQANTWTWEAEEDDEEAMADPGSLITPQHLAEIYRIHYNNLISPLRRRYTIDFNTKEGFLTFRRGPTTKRDVKTEQEQAEEAAEAAQLEAAAAQKTAKDALFTETKA